MCADCAAKQIVPALLTVPPSAATATPAAGLLGDTVVLGNEKLENKSLDTLVINGQQRSVIRDPSRDKLKSCRHPQIKEQLKKKEKQKGRDR